MELASKYSPKDIEAKWYQYWIDHKLFSSKPDGREPYTIVIPPPNVTGYSRSPCKNGRKKRLLGSGN